MLKEKLDRSISYTSINAVKKGSVLDYWALSSSQLNLVVTNSDLDNHSGV